MKANDYQVGGDHYGNKGYPHWDLALAVPLGYLDGCTTKYVARWRKKGTPVLDLKKALQYLNKLEESDSVPLLRRPFEEIVKEVAHFNEVNNLPDVERAYMAALCTWKTKEDLRQARELLFILMDEAEALAQVASEPRPVPLTDDNKHAERAPKRDYW